MNTPLRRGFAAFEQLTAQETELHSWPNAVSVVQRVPVYDGDQVRSAAAQPGRRAVLLAEWSALLDDGPGVFAITGALDDHAVIERASAVFTEIIDDQHRRGAAAGDHFAKPGANDRVWNSFEKHAKADPENFLRYYSSTPVALAAEAWLGPAYQMTTQVNRVNPGGAAQVAHRDYHLGFMSPEQAQRYPWAAHRMSARLTLQGAVAHCDMPIETGPTMYLPYSQTLEDGYVVFGGGEYQQVFTDRFVQLPLRTGDAVFFNPALMHGAGHNRTSDVRRMANLLQICSAFTRPMETVDRDGVIDAVYPTLLSMLPQLSQEQVGALIGAIADGYAFPTNLDLDPPIGGLAPASQADMLRAAVSERWDPARLQSDLCTYRSRRRSSADS
jgi:ectoine hydroxylase-related dioxygenase (phytanoyl-CoA dioxygenase family)